MQNNKYTKKKVMSKTQGFNIGLQLAIHVSNVLDKIIVNFHVNKYQNFLT